MPTVDKSKTVIAIINGKHVPVHPGVAASGHQKTDTSVTKFDNAFIARMKSGHIGIFERTGGQMAGGGDAIHELMGSSVPYESPSNKDAKIDGLCLADGTAVVLTFEQANALNGGGIVTALNFMGAWKVWGNYTGCYPSSTDPKDMFIPCGRMFAYVQNTIIRTCWQFLVAA